MSGKFHSHGFLLYNYFHFIVANNQTTWKFIYRNFHLVVFQDCFYDLFEPTMINFCTNISLDVPSYISLIVSDVLPNVKNSISRTDSFLAAPDEQLFHFSFNPSLLYRYFKLI